MPTRPSDHCHVLAPELRANGVHRCQTLDPRGHVTAWATACPPLRPALLQAQTSAAAMTRRGAAQWRAAVADAAASSLAAISFAAAARAGGGGGVGERA